MSIFEPTKYIYFHNNTDLPINISAWVTGSNISKNQIIKPRTKGVLHSSVGEWHIDSMFDVSTEEAKIWREKGLEKHYNIGKFRSDPCASGKYSFMEYTDPFLCIYSKNSEKKIKGTITFTMK